jgi:hypothetical protein
MGVSSNTLFHFTKDLEILKSIIQNGFKISYCLEEENAFPMVSFCDLPIASIMEQVDKYGMYALGLTLDWGRQNKLNPVFYFEEKSELIKSYGEAHLWSQWHMKQVIDAAKPHTFIDEIKPYIKHLLDTSRFQKRYSGTLRRGDKTYQNYKYYNEREWRFVPEIDASYVKNRLSALEYETYRQNHTKPHIPENPLTFKSSDIRYILIEGNEQIPGVIEFLESQNHLYNDKNEFQILITKIATIEMLREDI